MTTSKVESRGRDLKGKTGKTIEQWLEVVRKSKLTKGGEVVAFLQKAHGLGHATAQMIFQTSKGGGLHAEANADALVDSLFAGKHAAQRPTYEALVKAIQKLGPEVSVEPRRTYVTLASDTMFGLVKPGPGRVDLGLILPRVAPEGRLEIARAISNDRITHRIVLTSPADVDREVLRWVGAARERKLPSRK